MLAGALLSPHYCCRLSMDVLVGTEVLDVPGLTALVARIGVFQIFFKGDQLPIWSPAVRGLRRGVRMDELAYSLVCASAVRECAVRARSLGMAACLVCGAVRSRDVFSAAGCAVYVDIETCAPHFTRVCVRYGVWHTISIGVLVHPLD